MTAVLFGALVLAAQAALPPPPPVKYDVERLDGALRPEGGTFRLALTFTRQATAKPPEGSLTMTPDFADGWGRVFWAGKPVAVVAGDAKAPGRVEVGVPYPALPPGGYVFRGVIRDAAGATVTTVEAAMGRFERFDFQRDLVWLYWGGGPVPDAMAKTLLDIGLNGNGGVSPDHRFPYTWFRDHAAQVPMERYPEDVVRNPKGTNLGNFGNWTAWMAHEGGLVLVLMTDEIDAKLGDPAMRAVRLRLARRDPWMKVPTISRFNDFFRTDFLSWEEVFRAGFPPLDHPQHKGLPIEWTADRVFRDVETPMMRSALIRQANPTVLFGPGATHCLTDAWADSFNSRASNNDTTLQYLQRFISVQPNYGLRPGNKLCKLKPVHLTSHGEYWAAQERQYWASLACNDRMFLIYGPGDGFGAAPVTADGQVTSEGKGFQAIRNLIHPLRPTILSTRSKVDPAVVCLSHGHQDGGRNLMDGLVANGIMPRGAKAPGPEAKLIFAIDTGASEAVLDAVRAGAGLVCNGSQPALGIEPSTNTPAATGQEIDLAPLAKTFPGLTGVKVMGACLGAAKVKAGSGFEEVRSDGQLLAVTGPLGKGWVLYLNFTLQDMSKPNGWSGSWGASNLSLLTDDSIPSRNAALVRAMLARAGVPERMRVTDHTGRVAPLVRVFAAETHDGAQKYLYVVSEPLGKLKTDPADPKKEIMELACENPLTGEIRIMDPSIKAIRNLRTGKLLPLKADAQGVAVDYSFIPGQGTILSLLTEPPAGTISVQLSQADVAGTEVVYAEVTRNPTVGRASCPSSLETGGTPVPRPEPSDVGESMGASSKSDPSGKALSGHSLWVRFLDPQGREVEALTRWATGGGPHVFPATFALSDPEGEWTVVAEDQTDGTRAETKLLRTAKPAGPRKPFVPANSSLRSPYKVTLESTPYLDGDLILTEIRGTLKCSAAGPTPVTLRLPANPAGTAREVTVTSPKANAEVPFAIPLWMTRAQAQAVCGQRYEGVELTVTAPGLPADRFRYVPNILPLERAPQRIGGLAGGKVAVKVNNFTKTEQRVAITLAAMPGEGDKEWQASKTVAPQSSEVFERAVAALPVLADPGLYDVALDWCVGDAAQAAVTLPVEAVENPQEWWVKAVNPLDKVRMSEKDDGLAFAGKNKDLDFDKPKGEAAPTLPASSAEREKAGWRRVVAQGVVWWAEVAPTNFTFGRIYVATHVVAPKDTPVRVSAFGPTPPGIAWVNGAIAVVGTNAAPVALRQGRNEVILALEVTGKSNPRVKVVRGKTPMPAGYSLALLDPATGKRNRSLKIGGEGGGRGGKAVTRENRLPKSATRSDNEYHPT